MDVLSVKGKKAIVTGACQGIGKEIAKRLASNGASVLIVDISENIEDVAKEMNDTFEGEVSSYRTDLSIETNIEELVDFSVKNLGEINILVNNAGIMQTKPFLEITGDEWDRVLSINLKSMFLLSKHVVLKMRERGNGGSIVNISSIAGRSGRPLAPHYAASKAGVISLTKSMAEAFGKENIRTNAVCPGVIMTPMMEQIYNDRKKIGTEEDIAAGFLKNIKLDRLGTPEDISKTVLFLCSPLSDYINGQAINVCGGYEMN